MKSRTSSFNLTVFRHDWSRFAPVWGCYLILLLLGLVGLLSENHSYYRLQTIHNLISIMAWVNLIYGALVAQLLFGDLYNSRLCYALHAMPLTRENWFVTHTAAGLGFSVLPNLAVTLTGLILLNLGAGWSAAFWWLLASTLQYLFFFGIAVLCIMATGNRLGQIALYVVINFAGLLGYWLASSLYEPLLYGILIDEAPFYSACPVASFTNPMDIFIIDYECIEDAAGDFIGYNVFGVSPGEGWGYMTVCAALGIAALAGSVVLYRKRRLECAGDFVAFKCLEPVSTVLATIFCGGFFHLFGDAFGINMEYVLLIVGAVVGFFGCRMLLMRTTRVFRKKAFLGFGALMGVFALSLLLTWLDPVGLTRYLPEADEVESVTFSESYSLSHHNDWPFTATERTDIEALLSVHEDCIGREASVHPGTEEIYTSLTVRLEYKLKNGRTVNRFYDIYPQTEAGQILKRYLTLPECTLGFPAEKAHEMTRYLRSIYVDGMDRQFFDLDELDLDGMMDALLADAAAGNLVQPRGYHYPGNYDLLGGEYDLDVCYLEFTWDLAGLDTSQQAISNVRNISTYSSIRLYRSCTNTLSWLEENGLLTEEVKQYMTEKHGGAYAEIVIPTDG